MQIQDLQKANAELQQQMRTAAAAAVEQAGACESSAALAAAGTKPFPCYLYGV